jgi:hypothetical protein
VAVLAAPQPPFLDTAHLFDDPDEIVVEGDLVALDEFALVLVEEGPRLSVFGVHVDQPGASALGAPMLELHRFPALELDRDAEPEDLSECLQELHAER